MKDKNSTELSEDKIYAVIYCRVSTEEQAKK
jgi:hypothetical protein